MMKANATLARPRLTKCFWAIMCCLWRHGVIGRNSFLIISQVTFSFQVNAMVAEKKSSVKTLKEEAEKLDDLYHQKLKVEFFYMLISLLLIILSLTLVFICKNLFRLFAWNCPQRNFAENRLFSYSFQKYLMCYLKSQLPLSLNIIWYHTFSEPVNHKLLQPVIKVAMSPSSDLSLNACILNRFYSMCHVYALYVINTVCNKPVTMFKKWGKHYTTSST